MSGVVTSSLLPEAKPRREEEWKTQRDFCQHLRWQLPADAEFFSIPNGGMRHSKVQAKLIATGLKAGIPDLCVIYRGAAIFLELKTARGQLSEHQRQMHRKLTYCGATVLVCRSLDGALEALREFVPLRGSVSA